MGLKSLKSARKGRPAGVLDLLENRRLFSLDILGTEAPDSFVINVESDNTIHLNFNGSIEILNPPSDGRVDVLGFGGDDMIWLQNTGSLRFDLSGFAGNDTYRIGNGALERDIKKNVRVYEFPNSSGPPAHGGVDSIVIDDSISSGGTTYTLRRDALLISSSPSQPVISWLKQPEDTVRIQGSRHDDILFVEDAPANSVFNLGAGDDLVVLGAGDGSVATDLPGNAVIEDGPGIDRIIIDDSNPGSPRTSIDIDDSGLLGSINFRLFHEMEIRTHVLPDGSAEPVTFRGQTCPASSVTLLGAEGPDLVQFGTFQNPILRADLYVSNVTLKLKNGENRVEVDESDDAPGHAWTLVDNKLQAGIMTINNPQPVVGPNGAVDVLIKGTRFADRFIVARSSTRCNVTFDGRGGNDSFEQVPSLIPGGAGTFDLDDNFVGYVKFDGGAGDDTIILNDSQDETGDGDFYVLTSRGLRKGDFQQPADFSMEFTFVENVVLICDEDANRITFDTAGLKAVDIFGGGGSDTFLNRNDATQLPLMINSLGALTRLHGGAGSNILSLDDSAGGSGDYSMAADEFVYSRQATTSRVTFDGFSRIDIAGSNQPNTAILRSKPPAATMNLFLNGGDDTLIVGGGDIDGSGLNGATLFGGAGNDQVQFDDRLDDHDGVLDNDTFTFEFQTVSKGFVSMGYSGFESQTLLTSAVNNGPTLAPNLVRINATTTPTQIIDAPGRRDTTVEVGHGTFGLSQVLAPITLTSTAAMELSVFDLLSTSSKQFVIGSNTITQSNFPSTLNISHSGLSGIGILGGSGSDQFIVQAVAPGMTVFCNGGGGDDLVSVGNGSFVDIRGPVHFAGGAGTDKISFANLFDFEQNDISATVTAGTFVAGGGPLHQFFSGVEQVQLALFSSGATDVEIDSSAAVTIIGGSGDDHVTIRNLRSNVVFNGGGENEGDTLVIDDSAANSGAQYTIGTTTIVKAGGGEVTVNGAERVVVQAGAGHDTITVDSAPFALSLFGNAGNDVIIVNDSNDYVLVNTGAETPNAPGAAIGDTISVNIDSNTPGDVPAFVRIDQDDTVCLLQIGAGGVLRVENEAVLRKSSATFLQLILKGTIDLAGGALLYQDDGIDLPFRQWLATGHNGGAWNGASPQGAIRSSLAATTPRNDGVGYARGSELAMSSIGSYAIGATDLLVRYTLAGDLDLNQTVNITDFARLGTNFNAAAASWARGDFNYDNAIGIGDFALLAGNFNQASAEGMPQVSRVGVFGASRIEPGTLAKPEVPSAIFDS